MHAASFQVTHFPQVTVFNRIIISMLSTCNVRIKSQLYPHFMSLLSRLMKHNMKA